jgi:hypothetical protein
MLETVLDAEHSDEVLKHRQRLRKPLTDYAAKLLAKKLAQCPDPNAAADLMIEKGWQSVEPSWVQNSQQRAIGNQARSVGSVFGNLAAQMERDNGVRRIQGNEGIREAFPLLSFASDEPQRS